MTDAELEQIGMTREQWNKNIAKDIEYTQRWSKTINSNDI